jgi:hypothetical protein
VTRFRIRLVAGLFSLGIAAVQLSWLAVIPPFGGMDEFDHAYRAASVARGHFADQQPSPDARGELIPVPPDIVAAAHHRCSILKYTDPGNCEAQSAPDSEGDVLVASAASRYNPIYYAVVGTAARPFTGDTALYVMRLVTALLSDVLLAMAVLVSLRCARSWWPVAALMVAITPVALYASIVAAPNALQIAAGLLMWSAGLALATGVGLSERAERRVLLAFGAAVSTTLVTHTTGPLWVALSLGALGVVAGRDRIADVFRRARRTVLVAGTVVAGAAAFALAWIVLQRPNDPTAEAAGYAAPRASDLVSEMGLWVMQTVGGIPFRNDPPPLIVFAIAFLAFAGLVMLALRLGDRRTRTVVLGVAALTTLVPLVLTLATWSSVGPMWQGRYTLPLSVGIPLLAGWSLDRRARSGRVRTWAPVACCTALAAFLAVEVISQAHVRAAIEGPQWSPLDGVHPPALLFVGGVAAASLASVALALLIIGPSSVRLPDQTRAVPRPDRSEVTA